jgi:hypothetical protein
VGSSNTASLGVPAGRAAGTYAYVRMASNDDCVLPSNTYTVEVLDAPARPTGASKNSRCDAGTVTFSATVPAGVTIDWYTNANGTTLVSGGSGVASFSPTLTQTTSYHAEARHITAGCISASRLKVTGSVSQPAATGQVPDAKCGCASGLLNCADRCHNTCCGNFNFCSGYCNVTSTQYEGSGQMNWADAYSTCAGKGSGWRLPTNDELMCMRENKENLPNGYMPDYYWSGTQYDQYRYHCVDFGSTAYSACTLHLLYYVKCVKSS